MTDCIFCAIVAGTIPSANVYQDDRTSAFLDINPLQTGHALVIPRTHAARLEDLNGADAAALMHAVQKVIPAVCQAAGAQDATIAINDGPDAGQEVPHVHIHVIPRHQGDAAGPIHSLFAARPSPDADAINAFAATVKELLES